MKKEDRSDYQILSEHRIKWKEKLLLQKIYRQWYDKIIADLLYTKRKTIELGAGSGNFAEYYPKAKTADIISCPWLDYCFDAHRMPFADKTVGNLVLIDVLHHLENPLRFLEEASRVLHTGGRIIMLEPYPSPFSLPLYRKFHPEPFDFSINYFSLNSGRKNRKQKKKAWDSNQAIPYLLFFKAQYDYEKDLKLRVLKNERLSFFTYPLSGGFEKKSLIPLWLFPFAQTIEKILTPFSRLLAFRCYIVLEKI